MPSPGLPPLLIRQQLLLALIAGAVFLRAPLVGAGGLILLAFVPEWKSRASFYQHLCRLLAAFLLGMAVLFLAMPQVPDKPSWAAVPRQAVLVEGRIESAAGLPGGRVRILLGELCPAGLPSGIVPELEEKIRKALEPLRHGESYSGRKSYAGAIFPSDTSELPGLAALTLDAPVLEEKGRPLPGQKVTALVRLFPSGGSINAEEGGVNAYWAVREVWHNARLVRRGGQILHLEFSEGEGLAHAAAKARESWRAALERILKSEDTLAGAEISESSASSCTRSNLSRSSGGFAYEPEPTARSKGLAMLTALLFGDRSGLTLRTVELFTKAGLVHSLALSGQHLALAALAGVFCVFLLSNLTPQAVRRLPRRIFIACAGVPFALLYLFIGGAPFSLLRAALMMLAGAVFLCTRRISAPLDALLAAVFLLFLGWPAAVFDLSAQLSVLAVAGIMLSMPLVSAVRHYLRAESRDSLPLRIAKAFLRWSLVVLILSLATQAAVLPILASVFGVVSPCFWLNMLWLPPLTFITLPFAAVGLLLLVLFGPQASSMFLFEAAAWPADIMLALLEALDAMGGLPYIQCFRPAPLSSLGYCTILAALAFMMQERIRKETAGKPLRRLLGFGIFFLLAGQAPQWIDQIQARLEQRVTISMLDVGLGQSVLIEYPQGRILVDGGGSMSPYFDCGRSIVAPALTKGRLPRLDAVIVTHTDVDHARGLRWILEHFEVGTLYWSPVSAVRAYGGEGLALRELARKHGVPEKILRRGDTLELGNGLKAEVLGPGIPSASAIPDEKGLSNNDASLALRLVRDGQGLALLCGDMQSSALRRLVKSGQDLRADVLVLPHHGAASSFQKHFYDAVAPRAALASTASFSHYGFPSRKVREEMARRGIPVFSTSELGTFGVSWKRQKGRNELDIEGLIPCRTP
ncbi:MAG: DNA internalization-related competence protein ComEC/Rec2 [Mailhella sp.]|nr:DNA internalization-related competence protein ComEC/Rec2 [Mailhella sp.]